MLSALPPGLVVQSRTHAHSFLPKRTVTVDVVRVRLGTRISAKVASFPASFPAEARRRLPPRRRARLRLVLSILWI